jgi:hypothetical protein
MHHMFFYVITLKKNVINTVNRAEIVDVHELALT